MKLKSTLIGALLSGLALPAAAADASTHCAAMRDLVVTIAQARDRGMSLTQSHAILDKTLGDDPQTRKNIIDITDLIFSMPEVTPATIGGQFLKGCLKGAKGNV